MDYKRIIENLDVAAVKDLLERMDIPFQDKGDYLICKTACHNVDLDNASSKLYFYKNYKMFVCYTNCGNMSIFKFLRHYYFYLQFFVSVIDLIRDIRYRKYLFHQPE